MAAWTDDEQRALIRAYNAMLDADRAGQKINKAAINRWLRGETTGNWPEAIAACGVDPGSLPGSLAARNRASIELKLMNVSGARAELGLPLLAGYKPASNFQKSLKTLIQELDQ